MQKGIMKTLRPEKKPKQPDPLEEFWVKRKGFDRNSDELPRAVADCIAFLTIHGLREEGIFRVPGVHEEIKKLKKKYDRGKPVDFMKKIAQSGKPPKDWVNNVAGLLKLFFRELPDPIFPYQLFGALLEATDLQSQVFRMEAFRRLVVLLPPGNLAVFKELFAFFTKVIENQQYNKMSIDNLATVFAPTLFRSKDPIEDPAVQLSVAAKVNEAMKFFLAHHVAIFEPPKNLHNFGTLPTNFKRKLTNGAVLLASSFRLEQEDIDNLVREAHQQGVDLYSKKHRQRMSKALTRILDSKMLQQEGIPGPDGKISNGVSTPNPLPHRKIQSSTWKVGKADNAAPSARRLQFSQDNISLRTSGFQSMEKSNRGNNKTSVSNTNMGKIYGNSKPTGSSNDQEVHEEEYHNKLGDKLEICCVLDDDGGSKSKSRQLPRDGG